MSEHIRTNNTYQKAFSLALSMAIVLGVLAVMLWLRLRHPVASMPIPLRYPLEIRIQDHDHPERTRTYKMSAGTDPTLASADAEHRRRLGKGSI